jgi:hypothetical protein
MDTKELLKKVRKIEIKTEDWSYLFWGIPYLIQGMEWRLWSAIQYQYGDDIRAIDWNVTARYNEKRMSKFWEESELTMCWWLIFQVLRVLVPKKIQKDIVTEIAATMAFQPRKTMIK